MPRSAVAVFAWIVFHLCTLLCSSPNGAVSSNQNLKTLVPVARWANFIFFTAFIQKYLQVRLVLQQRVPCSLYENLRKIFFSEKQRVTWTFKFAWLIFVKFVYPIFAKRTLRLVASVLLKQSYCDTLKHVVVSVTQWYDCYVCVMKGTVQLQTKWRSVEWNVAKETKIIVTNDFRKILIIHRPALLTRMVMSPNCSLAFLAALFTSSLSERSQTSANTGAPTSRTMSAVSSFPARESNRQSLRLWPAKTGVVVIKVSRQKCEVGDTLQKPRRSWPSLNAARWIIKSNDCTCYW